MANYHSLTDKELVNALKDGQEQAFTEIYRRYQPALLRHAQRMLGNEEECRDILQEVFIKFWDMVPHFELRVSLSAYLHTLVRNRILDLLAQNKVRLRYFHSQITHDQLLTDETDETIIENELLRIIDEEITKLPDKMRRVFELSRKEHLSHKEISEQLQISTNTVKVQINHAIRRIRKRLGANFISLIFNIL